MSITTELSGVIASRFKEVQEFLSFIRQHEAEPPSPDRVEVKILRGMFFVHLYGAFEFSINSIVAAASRAINTASVPHSDVRHTLGVLVLDASFKSAAMAGADKRWSRRLDLIRQRLSSEVATITDGTVDLQNIWLDTLTDLYAVFGIDKPVVYDLTKTGYIRELVDTRNKIAHGRESPVTTGTRKRSSELQAAYEAIQKQTFYVLDCFDEYVQLAQYRLV